MKAQKDGGVVAPKNNKSLSITSSRTGNKNLKKLFIAMRGLLITTICLQNNAFAATSSDPSVSKLQQQVNKLQQQLNSLNKKVTSKVNKANYKGNTKYAVAGNNFIYRDTHGSGKFEQQSSSDLPLSLLKMKNMYPEGSLALGGLFEFEPFNSWYGDKLPTTGSSPEDYSNGTAASVSDVNFDTMVNVNDWTQVFTQFAYPGGDGKISLMSGFVTFGNLKKSPFFATVGKSRVRFGVFPGAPWAASIPQGIFRPGQLVNTTVGYSKGNFDAYLAYLPTKVKLSSGSGRKNGVMASAYYEGKLSEAVSYGVNAGFVSDVATTNSGVGAAVAAAVPAVDVDANVGVGPVNLSGGYQTTTKKDSGVTTTGEEKKASSYYAQAAFTTNVYQKSVTFAVNYSKAKNTENVAMPLAGDIDNGPSTVGVEKTLMAYAFTNLNKSLAVGLEYARMKTYAGLKTNEVTVYGAVYF